VRRSIRGLRDWSVGLSGGGKGKGLLAGLGKHIAHMPRGAIE
jgi:hypothetical protein